MTEKQMTEEELFESLWIDYSTDVEFLSDDDAYVITKPHFFYCLKESRKGMFTEEDMLNAWDARHEFHAKWGTKDRRTFDEWLGQYLTERKGRG